MRHRAQMQKYQNFFYQCMVRNSVSFRIKNISLCSTAIYSLLRRTFFLLHTTYCTGHPLQPITTSSQAKKNCLRFIPVAAQPSGRAPPRLKLVLSLFFQREMSGCSQFHIQSFLLLTIRLKEAMQCTYCTFYVVVCVHGWAWSTLQI